MFTGLVTNVGEVRSKLSGRIEIACGYDLASDAIGASIACDGCCLTVVKIQPEQGEFRSVFTVDVSNETLSKTTLNEWKPYRKINLERSLTPTSELGGHIVTGHVDGIAKIADRAVDGSSVRFQVEVEEQYAKFIAPKGCVALNGVSLTVNDVNGERFGINLIPHSLSATNWSDVKTGDRVNLEVDLLARYVARIAHTGH